MELTRRDNKEGTVNENLETGFWNFVDCSVYLCLFSVLRRAILLLTGGIVSIVTRKSNGKGGNIALIILYGLGALIGFAGHGSYSDLVIWAGWCLINAVLALVVIIKNEKTKL